MSNGASFVAEGGAPLPRFIPIRGVGKKPRLNSQCLFFTVNDGTRLGPLGKNPNSVRVIEAMQGVLSGQPEKYPSGASFGVYSAVGPLVEIICQGEIPRSRMIALFDKALPPGRHFSPYAFDVDLPEHHAAPSWHTHVLGGVGIGSSVEPVNCARTLLSWLLLAQGRCERRGELFWGQCPEVRKRVVRGRSNHRRSESYDDFRSIRT